ncbi:response regulator transcription factor [Sphingoaurantiacus capsulatus]|uniref:Response regulator transcription factor n=1 Tax=Sphingoaurantiacus capsulatus TaxID=1771310 RepID=A0ABV7XGV7_9SPHN
MPIRPGVASGARVSKAGPQEARGRVIIVDDDHGVRDATRLLLDTAGYEVIAYDSGESFLASPHAQTEGCLLLDVRLPGVGGLEVQQILRRVGSPLAVVILTGYADIPTSVAAMRAGAVDFIEKPYQPDKLLEAIDAALAAQRRAPGQRAPQAVAGQLVEGLSKRQLQVLEGLVAGLSNKTIARQLDLSPRTIEMHRADMMDRLGAESLSDALRVAYDAGLACDRRAMESPGQTGGRRASDPPVVEDAAFSRETSG